MPLWWMSLCIWKSSSFLEHWMRILPVQAPSKLHTSRQLFMARPCSSVWCESRTWLSVEICCINLGSQVLSWASMLTGTSRNARRVSGFSVVGSTSSCPRRQLALWICSRVAATSAHFLLLEGWLSRSRSFRPVLVGSLLQSVVIRPSQVLCSAVESTKASRGDTMMVLLAKSLSRYAPVVEEMSRSLAVSLDMVD